MKYPLFLKGKTKTLYIRYSYNKVYNYAIYYHFYNSHTYISPLVTDESENYKLFTKTYNKDCFKQLFYFFRLKSIDFLKKTICSVFRSFRDEEIESLEKVISHQKKIFLSVPQPSLLKQKFDDPRSSSE